MPLKIRSKGTSFTVIAEGDFKIDDVSESYSVLKKAFEKKATEVVFDFSAVSSVDVSFLQLICSAHKEAQQAGVTLKTTSVSDDMMNTINDLGFLQPDVCMAGDKKFCLWSAGRDDV